MTSRSFTVENRGHGARLDRFLFDQLEQASRSEIQKWIADGAVTRNGAPANKSEKLVAGDLICVQIPDPVELQAVPQDIPVEIVYEDEDLLVVNKPQGMVVHPAPGQPDGTLVNALLYHCRGRLSSINGVIRPGIVHRIDKDTSGLLIVAKTDAAHRALAQQISEHSFKRQYLAVVCGHMQEEKGTIRIPIGRSKTDRKKQAVHGMNERDAITHYEVLASFPGYDYCRFTLETGRTHQIRVHAAYTGHPVAGDPVYGGGRPAPGLRGQCLHAATIGFVHPASGDYLEFTAEPPDWFQAFLRRISSN